MLIDYLTSYRQMSLFTSSQVLLIELRINKFTWKFKLYQPEGIFLNINIRD